MDFQKKWDLAGTVVREARFKAQLSSNPSFRARAKEEPEKIMQSVRQGNIISMVFTTIFVIVLAAVSLGLIVLGDPSQSPITTMTVSLGSFLLLSFVLIFFFNLIGTSGFFMSGVATFPAMLPMSRSDFEDVLFLAFMRIFAGPSLAILTVLPVGFFLLIGPIAGLSAFFACGITVLDSFAVLILVARWYQRKSHEQPGSKLSTVIRVLTGVMLMIGVIAVYSVGNYLPVLVDLLITLSQEYGPIINVLFSLVFPFTVGMLTALATYGLQVPPEIAILTISASAFYVFMAFRGYHIARELLRETVMEEIETKAPTEAVSQPLKITSPILAIIKKDLRLATRDLGSLAILIFPLMILVAWAPSLARITEGEIQLFPIISTLIMVQSFAGISVTGLLGIDTQGASIYEGLPLSSMMNLKAKATLFMASYSLFMAVISVLLLAGNPFSLFAILIPLIQLPLGYGLALIVGGVLFRIFGEGRTVGVNPVKNQKATLIAIFVSSVVGSIPLIGLFAGMFLLGHIVGGLALQLLIVIFELFIARSVVPRIVMK